MPSANPGFGLGRFKGDWFWCHGLPHKRREIAGKPRRNMSNGRAANPLPKQTPVYGGTIILAYRARSSRTGMGGQENLTSDRRF